MPSITSTVWLRMVLVAGLVVPGAVFGTTAWLSYRHTIEAADRQIATTVLLLREQMARVLQSDELALDQIDQSIQGMTWEQIDRSPVVQARLSALLRQLPQIASIAVVAPDGRAANSNQSLPRSQLNVANRDYFLALHDHPELGTFISRTHIGRITHKPLFNIARRRTAADGRFDGTVVVSVQPSYLSEFYGSFAGPDGMAIILARIDGAVLARYPPRPELTELPPNNPMLAAARQSDVGTLSGRSAIDGTFRLAGFARIVGYPLVVSYGVSRAGVLAAWTRETLVYGPLTGAAALALALMTWFAMRGETKLIASRRRVEIVNSDLANQVAQRAHAETGLRELNAELEQRVAERTSSLSELAEQLERERLRLVTLIEVSPFAKLLVDRHGTITMTNAAAEQLFGYHSDELIGQTVEILVPQRFRDGHLALRDMFFAAPTARPMGAGLDVAALRKDGTEVAVEILLSPQHTSAGPVTIVGIADISARRQAQTALQQANTELVTANQELTLANVTIRLKSEEVEAFAYIISHDLRAPLINLQGFSTELKRGCVELRATIDALALPDDARRRLMAVVDEDINGTLPYIVASVTKFDRLINALLDLSRSGRYPLHPAPIDVAAVLQTTLDALHRPIEDAGARVRVGALPGAVADVTAVGQVFANLITNAVKFVAPDRAPLIEIGGEVTGHCAKYWVRDNGIGIPPQAQPRLFQVFQRFHPTIAPGDGIGLATVRRLVERQGGTVWAESTTRVGSTFHFTLPAQPE
jgi:PAS domain S-box-containing protein